MATPAASLRRVLSTTATVAMVSSLVACGGGSSGSDAPVPSTPDVPLPVAPPVSPEARETSGNTGLMQIHADAAYAQGVTGRSVTVAVIDSGIDLDHTEFRGRIHPASTDIVQGGRRTLDDEAGHGTHVAGIIGAAADGKVMHGVAPEAEILAIRTDLRDDSVCSQPGCGYFDRDVARAIDHAIDNGASIINLSLGKDGTLNSAYVAALRRAAARGVLIVTSSGNGGKNRPLAPGRLADDPGIRGKMLVVGAVDKNNDRWSGSNRAGSTDVAESFVVAPGVQILSTFKGGGYRRLTGTSMSAPHVSGAAALLKSRFPSLSMTQVRDILLRTARDLGDPGTDRDFGRGIIDIEAALRPSGGLSVPVADGVEGPALPFTESGIDLGSAFGNATRALAAHGLLVLDEYDRPYTVSLASSLRTAPSALEFEELMISRRDLRTVAPDLGIDGWEASLALSSPRDSLASTGLEARMHGTEDPEIERLAIAGTITDKTALTVGRGIDLVDVGIAGAGPGSGLFLGTTDRLLPSDVSRSDGLGVGLTTTIGGSTKLRVGALERGNGHDPMFGAAIEQTFGAVDLRLGMSVLREDSGLLGSDGNGAFAFGNGAVTRMVEIGANWRMDDRHTWFARALAGESELSGSSGVLRDMSGVRSQAVTLGLIRTTVMGEHDRLGILVAQPLRVSRADALLDLPVTRDLEGAVQRQRQRVDLTPDGRQIDLQIAYETPISAEPESGEPWRLGSWLLLRHQAGHDASHDLDAGFGMRVSKPLAP